jgi:hypothetical protein
MIIMMLTISMILVKRREEDNDKEYVDEDNTYCEKLAEG